MGSKALAILCYLWYLYIYYIVRPLGVLLVVLVKSFPWIHWEYVGELFVVEWNRASTTKQSMKEYVKDLWEGKYE